MSTTTTKHGFRDGDTFHLRVEKSHATWGGAGDYFLPTTMDDDGTIRVMDPVSGTWTLHHDLSPREEQWVKEGLGR